MFGFNFKLDDFQLEAINHIQDGKSVVVCAPTGAGKTCIAQSAIHLAIENGKRIPFIDENLDPFDGRWLAREILRAEYPPRADRDRGKDYNHSSFCDLVIRGLCGITVYGDKVTLKPLFDEEKIDYFCLDGVLIQGKYYTVLYDKYGEKYRLGKGIFAL